MKTANTVEWREEQRVAGKELRKLLIDADVAQVDVAERLDMFPERVSEFLNARRRWPEDFPQRFRDAVKKASAA